MLLEVEAAPWTAALHVDAEGPAEAVEAALVRAELWPWLIGLLSKLLSWLLMVVGLMAHGNLLLFDLLAQLVVHEGDPTRWRRSLLLEDAAHVM